MKNIPLTNSRLLIMVDDSFEFLSQWKWYLHKRKNDNTGYAIRTLDNKKMHRLIMDVSDPLVKVDHKDGDGLNNQKHNLRLATNAQNCANRKHHKNSTSKYKGVSISTTIINGKKYKYWRAQILKNGNVVYLGQFRTEKEAAVTYDRAALATFGEFAKLNFSA